MRRGLGLVLAIMLAIGIAASASGERYVQVCLRAASLGYGCGPRIEFDMGASISPRNLPRHETAPVALRFDGSIGLSEGSQLPALREMVLDVDRDLTFNPSGVPACRGSLLRTRDVKSARNACGSAIVGGGRAHVTIMSASEPIPATLTLFNGGIDGRERVLYIHSFLELPTPTPLIATVKIHRKHDGIRTITKVPQIADGNGSLLDFHFTIHRLFASGGEKTGYLEAKCPDSVFKINVNKVLLKNEAGVPGLGATTSLKGSLAVPCIPSGAGSR